MRLGGFIITCLLVVGVAIPADARPRKAKAPSIEQNVIRLLRQQTHELSEMRHELAALRRQLRPELAAVDYSLEGVPLPPPSNPVLARPMPLPDGKNLAGYADHIAKSAKLKDLTPGLRDKVAEILGACNTRVTSGYRRGARVAGSGRPSLHSAYPSQAADLVGDPQCIYSHLKKWPGGYSVDYAAVKHVHVSLGSGKRERGARFVHYRGGNRYAHRSGPRRYAHRQQHAPQTYGPQYAGAQ